MLAQKIDFDGLMEPVALRLLGEPNQKHGNEWRYGNRGSLAVDLQNGRWFDHEANKGGGVLDLIRRQGHDQPAAWLRREGLTAQPHVVSRTAQKIIKTYDYTDGGGVLLFQVVRFEPKYFRQRRPDGNGGWTWSLGETRRVLYRLPQIATAIGRGEAVYIVEGEKDAHTLGERGLTATTNPGGANKWRPEYAEALRRADVVIIGDNDQAGRDHVAQVASSLHGVARRVRVFNLAAAWPECPAKGDITGWIEAGHTVAELETLVAALPEWKPAKQPQEIAGAPSVAYVASVAWPVMDGAAYYGLAGEVVRAIEPHSEADPVALLLQFLTLAGNAIGRAPYYQVESDRHHANLFAVLVGDSAKARKGTSMGRVRAVVRVADETWNDDRLKGGLSSGEGLINEVRDPVQRWDAKESRLETVDPGVTDKRLMVVEPEFASALAVAERHGNTLSPLVRRAWDGDKLATMTRTSPLCATGAHISVIGHITQDELRARITRTDMANGFANRFLFALIRRSKELPFGGDLSDSEILHLGEQVKEVVERAKTVGRVFMTDAAKAKWRAVYGALSAGQPGLLGAITERGEAQTVRLALIYALLDGKGDIDEPHLQAALAVWECCEASAAHIFGNALGDPIADEILRALQQASGDGMPRTAIRDLFGRHKSGDRIGAALALLMTRGRARMEQQESGGRPVETWFATAEERHG
jgi:Protein of unknown function (DUF3987)